MTPAQTCAQPTARTSADAALDALRHELDLLPAPVRAEVEPLVAEHLRALTVQVRNYTIPNQRKAA